MNDRQRDIVSYVNANKQVSVEELASRFFVSDMTIRRDLVYLESKGFLKRYHGGAVSEEQTILQPLQIRSRHNNKEKATLAEKAAGLLENGQVIYLDSSSTCSYLVPHIAKFNNITVVTNSSRQLILLSERNVSTIFIGGTYYGRDMCCIGESTVEQIKTMNYDLGFFSSTGYIQGGKITDSEPHQTAIRIAALKNSQKAVFMFDQTKIGKLYPYTLCNEEDVFKVIISEE